MRRAAIAVATVGLAVAGYLTVVRFAGADPVCAIAHGCSVVQSSAYAELLGIPVALLGLVAYATLLGALIADTRAAREIAAGVALTGFAFSVWLTYVEIARLNAICAWCVVSAVCMTVLAGLCTARALMSGAETRLESGLGTGHRLGGR